MFKLAQIPYKINNPDQMTPDNIRRFVTSQLSCYENILEVGCGSGAISLDFMLNGGKSAHLIDIDKSACRVSELNAKFNNIDISIFNQDILNHVTTNSVKYDCIVVGTAWVNAHQIHLLLRHSLKESGTILVILREDVINDTSIVSLKEVVKCSTIKKIDAIIDPIDQRMRLIYQAVV